MMNSLDQKALYKSYMYNKKSFVEGNRRPEMKLFAAHRTLREHPVEHLQKILQRKTRMFANHRKNYFEYIQQKTQVDMMQQRANLDSVQRNMVQRTVQMYALRRDEYFDSVQRKTKVNLMCAKKHLKTIQQNENLRRQELLKSNFS